MARLINKLCVVFLLVLFTLNGCSAQNIAYFEGYDLVFNDEKYIESSGIYTEDSEILCKVNDFEIYGVSGDSAHNYLVARCFLDNYLYVKEFYVPKNDIVSEVSLWNRVSFISEEPLIELVQDIFDRESFDVADEDLKDYYEKGIEISIKFENNPVGIVYGYIMNYNDVIIVYLCNGKAKKIENKEYELLKEYCDKLGDIYDG